MGGKSAHLHVVILAGGPGTRLWPLSHEKLPKPYLPIPGPRTLIEETYRRARMLAPSSRIWVVATRAQRKLLADHLPQVPPDRLLLEPRARNTAPAIALAATAITKRDPDAVLAVLPADHVVQKPRALAGALKKAAAFCEKNYGIVCIGIEPNEPSTGYGYLSMGRRVGGLGVRKLSKFHEKPSLARAKQLLGRKALWNAGMFVFRGEVFINELEQHLPALHGPVAKALRAKTGEDSVHSLARHYGMLPDISIDYAVMEKTAYAHAVPCACGWSDVGSWTEALRVSGGFIKTPTGFARLLRGNEIDFRTGTPVAALGFEEVILVEGEGATLILHPSSAVDVGKLAKRYAKKKL